MYLLYAINFIFIHISLILFHNKNNFLTKVFLSLLRAFIGPIRFISRSWTLNKIKA